MCAASTAGSLVTARSHSVTVAQLACRDTGIHGMFAHQDQQGTEAVLFLSWHVGQRAQHLCREVATSAVVKQVQAGFGKHA